MNNLVIPHVKLSKSEILEISKELSISNLILKSYHEKMASRKGRKGYRDKDDNKFTRIDLLNLIYKNRNEDFCEIKGIFIKSQDVKTICKIKEKEFLILSNYSKLFYKLSKKYFNSNSSFEIEDLQGECFSVALKAMYAYSYAENNSLFTFIYCSVRNRLLNLNNNLLSPLGSKNSKIKQNYLNFQKNNPCLSFDEIVQKLKLSDKEIYDLSLSLNSNVVRESDLVTRSNESRGTSCCLEVKFSHDVLIKKDEKETFKIEKKSLKIIKDIVSDLSDLEREVLRGYLDTEKTSKKYNLGIGKYAKKLINPKTHKPYSKMAISYAWKRVQEKIKKVA